MTEHRRYRSVAAVVIALARAPLLISALMMLACALTESALAQTPPAIYLPGDAAVTGFSGAIRPFELEPGKDPNATTFIDSAGPSLRVVDLQRMGGPPQAQLVGARKPFTVAAGAIGQVFGIAIDNATPPNIYAAATSAYGLSIVASGADGKPEHVRLGAAGAAFMPAQWGPGGGPGSIWKIDGVTGAATLFATITTDGRPNSGPALGGLAFDAASRSLFVADRESGLIHRIGLNGADLGSYDHGVVGTAAAGLPPVPPPAAPGMDITSASFDSAQPETWGYAAPARRVFGLAVRAHRLYYAVAEQSRVWSVGLGDDGSFGSDARIELVLPPGGATEFARITFDDDGRMFLAERPAPTGAQDFEALSAPANGRVLRYAQIGVTETQQPIWQPEPDDYAVGLPRPYRNGNGGVAIGYSYDAAGQLNPGSCGGFVWITGEQLRVTDDPALLARISQPDMLAIDGLQGNPVWRIRRSDEPPLLSYFIDYADAPADPLARGHLGDIAIVRSCAREARFEMPPPPAGFVLPPPPPLRPGWCKSHVCGTPNGPGCPHNQIWHLKTKACSSSCAPPQIVINGQCCSPADLQPGGACAKGPPSGQVMKPMCGQSQTAIGPDKQCCENANIYTDGNGAQQCCANALVNGVCNPSKVKIPDCPGCCAPNYVKIAGKCCLKSHAASGQCCPSGQVADSSGKLCVPQFWLPKISQCCASGFVPVASGKCCAQANVTTSGECCASALDAKDRSQCKASPEKKSTSLVPLVPNLTTKCQPNERRAASGACVPRKSRGSSDRSPIVDQPIACPRGFVPGPMGQRCWPVQRGTGRPIFGGGRIGPPAIGGGRMGPPAIGGRPFAPGRRW